MILCHHGNLKELSRPSGSSKNEFKNRNPEMRLNKALSFEGSSVCSYWFNAVGTGTHRNYTSYRDRVGRPKINLKTEIQVSFGVVRHG